MKKLQVLINNSWKFVSSYHQVLKGRCCPQVCKSRQDALDGDSDFARRLIHKSPLSFRIK